jgi:uncharacterized repeat protein (TIGR01451 family)
VQATTLRNSFFVLILEYGITVVPLAQCFYRLHHRVSWRCALSFATLILQGATLGASVQKAIAAPNELNTITNAAQYYYQSYPGEPSTFGITNTVSIQPSTPLIDPRGQILGCGGKPLESYSGFSVALYTPNAADPAGIELGELMSLTPTELPDIRGNNIPSGIAPNSTNINPFPLSDADQGKYSFLLDRTRGQIEVGKTYILVINPSTVSTKYTQRRIRLKILSIRNDGTRDIVAYQATSLDGLPIGTSGTEIMTEESVLISDADQIELQTLAFQLSSGICQSSQIQVTKSGDRASAQPGDTVVYRLSVRNNSDIALQNIALNDVLPAGFKFVEGSIRATFGDAAVPVVLQQQGQNQNLRLTLTLPTDGVVNLSYAAQLTTDALRGSGTNLASVTGARVDNNLEVRDGPVMHKVRMSAGLFSDAGILIGRVFEDRNFDGEQQTGEPGIPNAVVFLEDGNRVTTDPNGLFSVKGMLPGYHTGVLDPLSIPGYRLAPNRRFIERNSASRLVRLAPGSMVRMNFGVMPESGGT